MTVCIHGVFGFLGQVQKVGAGGRDSVNVI
jgi:hypothetical protein